MNCTKISAYARWIRKARDGLHSVGADLICRALKSCKKRAILSVMLAALSRFAGRSRRDFLCKWMSKVRKSKGKSISYNIKRYPRLWTAGLSWSRGSCPTTAARESTDCFFRYVYSFECDCSVRILSIWKFDMTRKSSKNRMQWSQPSSTRERSVEESEDEV